MESTDVVPYLTTIRGSAWLSGQQVPEDGRTPTPAQLLALPAQPAIVSANVLVGDSDDYSHDAGVQKILTAHAQAGGLVSLCMHPPNPFSSDQTITSAWVSNQDTAKPALVSLYSASAVNTMAQARYMRTTQRLIAYIKTLPVNAPVIMRPWHEAGGKHFWWGRDVTNPGLSEASVKALWADTIRQVTAACPNVIPAFSGAMTWSSPILYGYPGTAARIVGASLYSDSMEFANGATDYSALVGTGAPALLFETGSASAVSGWPATNILTALTNRYPSISGWVSWQDNYSLLEMSGSAAVLADPRVVNRDRLSVGA